MRHKGLGRVGRGLAMVILLQVCAVGAAVATANLWAGPDPTSNYPAGHLPSSCFSGPASARCVNAGVYYLDKARGKLGQKPYKLPANFTKLSPAKQAFILVNLDRVQYKLPPITGLTQALDSDALGGLPGDPLGVKGDGDPRPTAPSFTQVTSNWAGGYSNIVLAYESWMYDDGYKSPNIDCTQPSAAGCWGHRHDVLWKFVNTGSAAMGAAAGKDSHGARGFAILLGRGNSSYHPKYVYTWKQAVADGAGKHIYVVHQP